MGRIENRLNELGLELPAPIVPPGNYELVKVHGGLAYVAGHGPFDGAKPIAQGVVGRDLTLEEGLPSSALDRPLDVGFPQARARRAGSGD
jgi:hypothetical protein